MTYVFDFDLALRDEGNIVEPQLQNSNGIKRNIAMSRRKKAHQIDEMNYT